jgi:DNA-binding phage protein
MLDPPMDRLNQKEVFTMTPFAAIAVKTVGAAGAAGMLSLGLAGGLVLAASPSHSPATDHRTDRRAVATAVFESEADVLGIGPKMLREDLKRGQKVSDLAKDKGMTKEQFASKLVANVRPRLAALVDHKVIITQAKADKVIDRISQGHVPFWDGLRRTTAAN